MTIAETSRHVIGMLCITLYLIGIPGLLTPLTGKAPVIVTECRGECARCGCSPEASALKLCCCARKKQQQHTAQWQGKSCCKKEHGQAAHPEISPLPCGSGKYADSGGFTNTDHIPHRTQLTERAPGSALSYAPVDQNGPDFHRPPPDPPPRFTQVFSEIS